jgi:hypothetical protein
MTMRINSTKTIFWGTFGLVIIVLPLNFGLGLIALGLLILPILILHFTIGLSLNKIQNHKGAIIFSAINLLLFALLRPDGVHALTESGLSSLLSIFGINAGYSYKHENYFFYSSLILLLIQVVMDLRLRKLARR